MNTRWVDKTPPRPFHPLAFGAAILVIIGIALIAFAPFAAANPPAPTTNQVEYWCPFGGEKFEPVTTPYIVPNPPEGKTWVLLVLKAGNEETSVLLENELFANPVVGQSYVRSDAKSISHVILCYGATTTTTIATTTTANPCPDPPCVPDTQGTTSTTLATTTTATTIATTTTAATTTTRPPCPDCSPTQQTAPTTASTLPLGCVDCNIPPPPTTTVASTVTVPFTVATTLAPTTVPPVTTTVAAPTTPVPTPPELPVTGGDPIWLAVFGACLIALGALGWAWTRT